MVSDSPTPNIRHRDAETVERTRIRILFAFGLALSVAMFTIKSIWPPPGLVEYTTAAYATIITLLAISLVLLPESAPVARVVLAINLAVIVLAIDIGTYASMELGLRPQPTVILTGGIVIAIAIAVEFSVLQQAAFAALTTLGALVAVLFARHDAPHVEAYSVAVTATMCAGSVWARRWLALHLSRTRAVEDAWLSLRLEFAELIERIPDLVQRVDPHGRLTYVNPAWAEKIGISREAAIGKSIWEILHPDDVDHCRDAFERLQNGERVDRISCRFVCHDGHSVWLDGNLVPPSRDHADSAATLAIFRDVTAEVQLEQELRNSRQFLANALDAIPSRIALLDRSLNVLHTNRTWTTNATRNRCPYPMQRAKVGDNLMQCIADSVGLSPSDRNEMLSQLLNAATTGCAHATSVYHCACDRDSLWFNFHTTTFEHAGEPYILVDQEDITLIKVAERATEEARARFDRAVSGAHTGIWEYFPDRDELYCSPRLLALAGATAPPVRMGLEDWLQHLHPEDAPTLREAVRDALSGKRPICDTEVRATPPGRHVVWLHVRASATHHHSRGVVLSGSMIDVTERHAAITALTAKEHQLQEMVDSALHAIVSMDCDGNVVEYNPAAQRMFGFKRALVMGAPFDRFLPKDIRARARSFFDELIHEDARRTFAAELILQRADDSPFDAELIVFVGAGARPGEVYVHTFVRDVSRQRELARIKDSMIATLSHELRTPLTSLHGFAELLAKREFPRQTQVRYLEIIQRETKRLTRIVNGLLELRRTESIPESLELRATDTRKVAEQAIARVPLEWRTRRNIFLEAPPELPLALADVDALGRIFDNLLSNACKYSREETPVTVRLKQIEDRINCAVLDEGIGIPAADMKHLFDEFFRGETAKNLSVSGTGLGLPICKKIVEAQNGAISVESTPGRGTRAWFELPIAEAEPSDPPEKDQGAM